MQTEPLEFVDATDRPSEAVARTDAPEMAAAKPVRAPRTFAGYRLTTIGLVALLAVLFTWNAWLTREVVALKRQKIVSVSLASLITDFVRDQSHAAGSPDDAAMRTRLYLVATQKALTDLAGHGAPVIASEAVLGNSVPDKTGQVKAAVATAMADQAGRH